MMCVVGLSCIVYFRILDVIETVSERIPLPENETQVIISLTSFAVAVREVDTESFNGQVFSANLGGEFNFEEGQRINSMFLFVREPGVFTAAETASLNIPSNIFENEVFSNRSVNSTRITNSVFLNDALFSRRATSASKDLKVGGIVMAASLSNGRSIKNLSTPILLTFLKKPSLKNASTASCRFWDFTANGK